MNPARRQRLFFVLILVVLAAVATGLVLYALRANMNLFYSPSQVAAGEAPVGRTLRAGGMVREHSVQRIPGSLAVDFVITDFNADLSVHYDGILPDLFREGQGIVVIGTLNEAHQVIAEQVLAKHDENYTPPEVAESLKHAKSIETQGRP